MNTHPPLPDQTFSILYCANARYFPHVAVSALSAADSNRGAFLDVHLITCDRDDAAETLLRQSFAAAANLGLTLHRVEAATVSDFFVDGFLSKECYLRLFAPQILPESIDRLIYLDSDTVVVDDLGPLWSLDLGDDLVAAAPDYPLLPAMVSPDRLREIGLPAGHPYVNSGVLVMDLSRWRADRTTERLVRFIEQQGARLVFHDQDAINAVLQGRIHLLDCRWNLQARMYLCGRRQFPREVSETVAARRRPAILHYTGSEKPWLFRSRIPRKGDYIRYRRKTAWPPDETARALTPAQRAEFALDRALSLIGIDYLQVLWTLRRVPVKLAGAVGLGRPGVPRP
ncbi:glycosyltransferase family 8 protein [Paracoccaceae bacterium Fryx2]|nr:glycosyltransferase family 8 protein [Paracoccaceae bacterium Fryx2]